MDVRTFVSLDTETGIVRRYSENAHATHIGGLTNDPDDEVTTLQVLQEFRTQPPWRLAAPVAPGLRTYEDALADQRLRLQAKERDAEKQLLLGPPSHRDEA